ncbi:hypothetical protein BD414DRAFT_416524 [Trametes punicea]|nr:hypothetical protein BD414DRAFT_416524 [Trametes punicea]
MHLDSGWHGQAEEFEDIHRQNQQLEARILELETHLGSQAGIAASGQAIRSGQRAGYTARGALTRHRRRRGLRSIESGTAATGVQDDGVFCPNANAVKDDSDPLSILKLDSQALSPMQKKAMSKMQASVSASFRETTGVLTPEQKWPKWTGDDDAEFPGMPVNFEATVEHPVNRALLRRVADVAMQDLQKNSAVHADWMNAIDVKLTLGLLIEIAKGSFRGFRRVYKAQFDEEQKKRMDDNARAARWLNRRKKKCSNLAKAVDAYKAKYGLDPTPFLVQEMMSDEASGPEDETVEPKEEWRRRIAEGAGIIGRTDAELKKMVFFEVISPRWRSEALTTILHELWGIFWDALSTRAARAMTPRVTNTGRATDVPPQFAPYNIGINRLWFENFKDKDTHRIELRDWFKYPDPPGFGETPNDDLPSSEERL